MIIIATTDIIFLLIGRIITKQTRSAARTRTAQFSTLKNKIMNKIYLTYLNGLPFLMVNAYKNLTIKQCNSEVVKKWNIKNKDKNTNVFELFDIKIEVVNIPFDRRTSQFKSFEKKLKYFNVSMLPLIKEVTTI